MKRKAEIFKLIVEDILLINLSYVLALFIRFDATFSERMLYFMRIYWSKALIITAIKLVIFAYFDMYKTIWKYSSIKELTKIVVTIVISNIVAGAYILLRSVTLPRSIYLIAILLDMVLIGGLRLSYRTLNLNIVSRFFTKKTIEKRIMIIGAGDAGAMIIREYRNHPQLASKPVVMIDDDKSKQGQIINGVLVAGGREDLVGLAEKYKIDEIVIAIPSATKKDISSIIEIAKETRCKLKIVPGLYEIIDKGLNIKEIRDVQIEDILGREEIDVDLKEISNYISNKTIMVTGGGGSIGSELCRQIADLQPKELIIFDIYENSAYEIQNELIRDHKDLNLRVYIGSVRDKNRVKEILEEKKPDIIFHAAAHKHVTLMENNPKEAIKNNVFGTLNLAQLADEYKVKRFVMISTDKAVNPTNIMGASKRICEMIVQSLNLHSETEFVSVRFGNVLGSNGSVIPLFKKQISLGGPVTVTHKEIIRYFMTIKEAVQLVIQAGSMAKGGEIFILDMGEPVKIIDLARDLIKLSGFEPETEIPIEIVGLRPGEKLYEELLLDEEGIKNTKHDKIFVGQPLYKDYQSLLVSLEGLNKIMERGSNDELIQVVKNIVPNYGNYEEINNL